MTLSIEQVARSISGHTFADAYPYLTDTVRWNMVGGELLEGKDAVVQACDASAAYLSGVTTTFDSFKVIVADDCVVIESSATYSGSEGDVSRVASCDVYGFVSGMLSQITSYNIELTGTSLTEGEQHG